MVLKFNSVSGTLSVTGDLVAFASDDRLKTNKEQLTGALDKFVHLMVSHLILMRQQVN